MVAGSLILADVVVVAGGALVVVVLAAGASAWAPWRIAPRING